VPCRERPREDERPVDHGTEADRRLPEHERVEGADGPARIPSGGPHSRGRRSTSIDAATDTWVTPPELGTRLRGRHVASPIE
jgi:hypothetical protein